MNLYHIVACSENNVIGKDNKIPWHIPEDLKHFKKLTQHSTIIMGRKTYESIGRPLPNRRNIIVSKTMPPADGVEVVQDLETALRLSETAFIIGGETLYRQTIDRASKIYLTRIHKGVDGDTFYPELPKEFKMVESKNFLEYSFITYIRQN